MLESPDYFFRMREVGRLRQTLVRVHVKEWVGSLLFSALAHAKHFRIAVPTILSAGEECYAVAAC